ncbi:MAG: hypothetical protein EHM53_11725 [Methanoregulaceae archaeon]|nr:MAG: hypothetical protein EHM53_11725 [Methanoregulaceae archaeon]
MRKEWAPPAELPEQVTHPAADELQLGYPEDGDQRLFFHDDTEIILHRDLVLACGISRHPQIFKPSAAND